MKLFVSFTTLLGQIAANAVTQEELDTGLYYFGCIRSHAFAPGAEGEFDERVGLREKGGPAHEKLVQALNKAEAEGRCSWHHPELGTRKAPYTLLNELLVANGIGALPLKSEFEPAHYSYPTVRELMAEVPGKQAEVVY